MFGDWTKQWRRWQKTDSTGVVYFAQKESTESFWGTFGLPGVALGAQQRTLQSILDRNYHRATNNALARDPPRLRLLLKIPILDGYVFCPNNDRKATSPDDPKWVI